MIGSVNEDWVRRNQIRETIKTLFSHSALKEGWDNPNVFQICTLKDTTNEIKKRQEVRRGMRLCVNEKGERQGADVLGDAVFDTDILTVIARESYDDFAKKLQTEITEACDSRPVVVTASLFADVLAQTEDCVSPENHGTAGRGYSRRIDSPGVCQERQTHSKVF